MDGFPVLGIALEHVPAFPTIAKSFDRLPVRRQHGMLFDLHFSTEGRTIARGAGRAAAGDGGGSPPGEYGSNSSGGGSPGEYGASSGPGGSSSPKRNTTRKSRKQAREIPKHSEAGADPTRGTTTSSTLEGVRGDDDYERGALVLQVAVGPTRPSGGRDRRMSRSGTTEFVNDSDLVVGASNVLGATMTSGLTATVTTTNTTKPFRANKSHRRLSRFASSGELRAASPDEDTFDDEDVREQYSVGEKSPGGAGRTMTMTAGLGGGSLTRALSGDAGRTMTMTTGLGGGSISTRALSTMWSPRGNMFPLQLHDGQLVDEGGLLVSGEVVSSYVKRRVGRRCVIASGDRIRQRVGI